MKTVADITSADIGKRVRIRLSDGADIEGTLHSINAEASAAWSETVLIKVSFEELSSPSVRGGRYWQQFSTWGHLPASEVEEEKWR